MRFSLKTGKGRLLLVVVLAALAVTPFVRTGYVIRFLTTVFMYAALSQVWNILGGFAGYISLGLVGFVGIGAYGTGILMNTGIGFYAAVLIVALLASLLSLCIGMPVLRLRAGYYSIATFAIAFVLRELANNWTWFTGGGMGLSLPIMDWGINAINTYFYFCMLVVLTGVTWLCVIISKSSLGYGLMAIKEDEDAANVLGINTTAFKVVGFIMSAFIAAFIGGIYGYWLTFIEPLSAFDANISIMVIIMAMVGGAGTVIGPVIGAVLISIISEVLWNQFMSIHQMMLGILLILVVIFLPKGIMDIFLFRREKFSLGYLKKILSENISKYKV
jgi:branched-chain amino acid transport system permease protein